MKKNKILITGAAGFIGAGLTRALAAAGNDVTGIDIINDYYDINLKYGRLSSLCGINRDNVSYGKLCNGSEGIRFVKGDITDKALIDSLFDTEHFNIVINLAAQAGVRFSITNPYPYIDSNVTGFLNILEACRNHSIDHLIFASSSSIYGLDIKVPYNETDSTDTPVSLYAATKKSDELMAHAYSHLYGFKATGLRFFTVYCPWGRPDMAPFKFMRLITEDQPIEVYNNGKMSRDFTYIDDIVAAVVRIVEEGPKHDFHIYNIGHSSPVDLMDFIHIIESTTGHKAQCEFRPMQPGDVVSTFADVTSLKTDYDYSPSTDLKQGIAKTYEWYRSWKAAKH
jgi:UDP-glucuronate 4-epimerase